MNLISTLPRNSIYNKHTSWVWNLYLGDIPCKLQLSSPSPYGLRPSFHNSLPLKCFFNGLKDPIPANKKSSVYKLCYGDCKGVYIGETGGQFEIRLKEHTDAWHGSSVGTLGSGH